MNECQPYRQALGAYVLGGLDLTEVAHVEQHLAQCHTCDREHAELTATVGLLELVDDRSPPVPERVRDRVVATSARRRTRRRFALVAAAAVAIATMVGVAVGWQLAPDPVPEVALPLEEVEPFEAAGSASYRVLEEQVVMRLEVDDLEPLPTPSVYEAWLSTADGRVISIGQLGPGGEPVRADLPIDGGLDDYHGFWITAEPDGRDPAHDGPTVLRAPVPALR